MSHSTRQLSGVRGWYAGEEATNEGHQRRGSWLGEPLVATHLLYGGSSARVDAEQRVEEGDGRGRQLARHVARGAERARGRGATQLRRAQLNKQGVVPRGFLEREPPDEHREEHHAQAPHVCSEAVVALAARLASGPGDDLGRRVDLRDTVRYSEMRRDAACCMARRGVLRGVSRGACIIMVHCLVQIIVHLMVHCMVRDL